MTMPQTLTELFLAGEEHGDRPAMVYRTGVRRLVFSYAETIQAAHAVAAELRRRGVKPGDRVLLLAPNGPAWVWSFFGILLAGGVVVPADMRAQRAVVEGIATDAGVTFVMQTALKPPVPGAPRLQTEALFLAVLGGRLHPDGHPPHRAAPDDVAELLYTSGTTGAPKGVILRHRNILANLAAVSARVRVAPTQSTVSVLPLSHVFAFVIELLTFWMHGARVVYLRSIKPSEIFAALTEEQPTNLVLVPRLLALFRTRIEREASERGLTQVFATLRRLAHARPRAARRALFHTVHRRFGSGFQYFVVGGAPLPDELHRFWDDLGFVLVQGYGLTETSPILTCNTPEEQHIGSVGQPLPGIELKIADDGEVLAKGPNVFSGYYQNPEKTTEAFTPDGWFHTGDLGELREGWLVIKGRKKDLIIPPHGMNVYAEDVEQVLTSVPGVRDAAVIGMPAENGEHVHAVLLLEPQAPPPADLIQQANARLDSTQQITGWTVWPQEDFPRTATLKVRKFLVREAVLKGADQKAVSEETPSASRVAALVATATNRPLADVRMDAVLSRDLGLDSVGRLELVSLLESELAVDIEESEITAATTVRDLEALAQSRRRARHGLYWSWPFAAWIRPIQRLHRWLILFPLLRYWIRVEAIATDRLSTLSGPALFVANHVSAVDVPVLLRALPARARRRLGVFARADLFTHPSRWKTLRWRILFFIFSTFVPIAIVPQDRGFRRTLTFAGRQMDRGYSFILFPEGQRTETGTLLAFRAGAGISVQEFLLPVVPVKLEGLFALLPRHKKWPRRGRVRVIFGAPLFPTAGSPEDMAQRLAAAVKSL